MAFCIVLCICICIFFYLQTIKNPLCIYQIGLDPSASTEAIRRSSRVPSTQQQTMSQRQRHQRQLTQHSSHCHSQRHVVHLAVSHMSRTNCHLPIRLSASLSLHSTKQKSLLIILEIVMKSYFRDTEGLALRQPAGSRCNSVVPVVIIGAICCIVSVFYRFNLAKNKIKIKHDNNYTEALRFDAGTK